MSEGFGGKDRVQEEPGGEGLGQLECKGFSQGEGQGLENLSWAQSQWGAKNQPNLGGQERRALNMVWNAAEDASFKTPFLAYYPNGQADLYMNTIVGLGVKYLGEEALRSFFEAFAGVRKEVDFDTISWLGLEDFLFQQEKDDRPVLFALRREKARVFFDARQNLSRQEMMAQNVRVYEQEEARWAGVLGEKGPWLGPGGRALCQALTLSKVQPTLTPAQVLPYLQGILEEYFHLRVWEDPSSQEAAGQLRGAQIRARETLRQAWIRLCSPLWRHQRAHQDSLLLSRYRPVEEDLERGRGRRFLRGIQNQFRPTEGKLDEEETVRTDRDEAYIAACFGPQILPPTEVRALESRLCQGHHETCRLWFARPGGSEALADQDGEATQALDGEAAQVQTSRRAQEKANRAAYEDKKLWIDANARLLADRLHTIFAAYSQPLPFLARQGGLAPSRAWRLAVLQDDHVFYHKGDEMEMDLSVDLILDASASRMNLQEDLVCQAYLIAKSLLLCHIPVQVQCFQTIRGFTILQTLKTYEDQRGEGLFAYYAGGWNRDGLALPALATKIRPGSQGALRLALILTDASPIDSVKMRPTGEEVLARSYEGEAAIRDTQAALTRLEAQGLALGAIFMGPTMNLDACRRLYKDRWVRIHKIHQLADGVTSLLLKILQRSQGGRQLIY